MHAGLEPDPTYGAVIPPIHQTSTFVQQSPGKFVDDYDYSRAGNPTRTALEGCLGALEGGHGAAFGSGMAATHALLGLRERRSRSSRRTSTAARIASSTRS